MYHLHLQGRKSAEQETSTQQVARQLVRRRILIPDSDVSRSGNGDNSNYPHYLDQPRFMHSVGIMRRR
jgi:hypothetical protein